MTSSTGKQVNSTHCTDQIIRGETVFVKIQYWYGGTDTYLMQNTVRNARDIRSDNWAFLYSLGVRIWVVGSLAKYQVIFKIGYLAKNAVSSK